MEANRQGGGRGSTTRLGRTGSLIGSATDRKVALMTAGTTLHLLVLQIRGCELARLEEV